MALVGSRLDIWEKYGRVGRVTVGLLSPLDKETRFYEERSCRYSYKQEKEKSYESDLSENSCWDILLNRQATLMSEVVLYIIGRS